MDRRLKFEIDTLINGNEPSRLSGNRAQQLHWTTRYRRSRWSHNGKPRRYRAIKTTVFLEFFREKRVTLLKRRKINKTREPRPATRRPVPRVRARLFSNTPSNIAVLKTIASGFDVILFRQDLLSQTDL